MKQRKWMRRAAKALVLALMLSLTLCVTAHANVVDDLVNEITGGKDGYDKNGAVGLVLWGFDGDATVSWGNGSVSKPYSSHVNVPGMIPVTVTFEDGLNSVKKAAKFSQDGAIITDVDDNSFTFICYPFSGSQANFIVDVGRTDPADPADPGKTDPADPGKTDPADPANTNTPADPSKPSTGDTMLIALWAVVLMGTAVGITALVRSKKRA